MEKSDIIQLIQRAKDEPEFFRCLVFQPEKALSELKWLDPLTKESILKMDPNAILNASLEKILVRTSFANPFETALCSSSYQ